MKIFETWTHKGIRYLAIPTDHNSIHIVDENGENYGAWFDRKSFESLQMESLGKNAHLEIRAY